jgi:hypothetical protein
MTPLSAGTLDAAESRLLAVPKTQGIQIYPPSSNGSIYNARKGIEPVILGNYHTLVVNRTYVVTRTVTG